MRRHPLGRAAEPAGSSGSAAMSRARGPSADRCPHIPAAVRMEMQQEPVPCRCALGSSGMLPSRRAIVSAPRAACRARR
jgi:hypothetical protein